MTKAILSLGALLVAFFEAIGFETVRQYLRVLDIPLHLATVPLVELTSWAMPVFFSSDVLPLYVLCGVIVAIEYIRFLASATSRDTEVVQHYRSGKDVSPLAYLFSHVIGQDSSFLGAFARVGQIAILVLVVIGFFSHAEVTGDRIAQAALTGRVYGTAAQADLREAIHLEPKKDAVLPAGIRAANAHGALVELWLEDKTVYVAPIHATGIAAHGRSAIFAVDRDAISVTKYSRQWQQPKAATPVPAKPDWTWLAVPFAGLAFVLVGVLGYLQQREQVAMIAEATGEELRELTMPIGEAQTIVRAVQRGRDVYLNVRGPNGTRRIWLRAASIEHGLVTFESAPPTTGTLLRRIFSALRRHQKQRE
jgi:hypothetical protein